jgi:hypothetical protein
MVACTFHPSYKESRNSRISIQAKPNISIRPYSKKVPKAKRAGGMVQVVEYLSTEWKALNSNPSTIKEGGREGGMEGGKKEIFSFLGGREIEH